MKRFAWIALPALVAIVLVPTTYVLLTGRAHAHTGVAAAPKAVAAVQGTGSLTYRGGPVQTQPVSYLIFWGGSWSNGGTLTTDGQVVKNYFTDVGGSFYFNTLTQYSNISSSHTLAGVYLDTSAPPTDGSCGSTPAVQDSAIQSEVNKAISSQGWTPDRTNATFYVYTPSGTVVNDGNGACAPHQFCAYHNWSSSGGFTYAAIAYPTDLTGCGVASSPNGNIQGDSLASLSARVQFGAITDPQPAPIKTGTTAGWLDDAGYEIGDKCGWDTSAGLIQLKNGHTYALQTEFSNTTGSCIGNYSAHFQPSSSSILLTTAPGVSPADQTITFSNTGDMPMSWIAGATPSWLSLSATYGNVPIGGSTTVTVHFTIPPTDPAQTYNASLTFGEPHADNWLTVSVTVRAANPSKQWYFAEGYTGGSFATWLTLANPNPTATNATITYYLDTGGTIVVQRTLAANSRFTEPVNNDIGSGAAGHSVSIGVTADAGIVAERPMYFTYTGLRDSGGPNIPSGSDALGATALASRFDFGYLDTTPGHDTWLTVLNRDPSLSMDAVVTLFPASGASPTNPAGSTTLVVAPSSRGTLRVNSIAGLAWGTYSAVVQLFVHGTATPLPGLVERPLYAVDSSTGWTGAADVIGVPSPTKTWNFAEGYSAWNFSERYVLANPCATADCSTTPTAHVQLTYLLSDGSQRPAAPVTLAPGQQVIVAASATLGSGGVNNSATVSSDQPILAERLQSFVYSGWQGLSDVLGATQVGQLYDFAEGYIYPNQFNEWLTIENPDASQTAQVVVTFLPDTSAAFTRSYTVGPHSRFTLNVASVILGNVSLQVESSLPIVAERPMYFNYSGSGQTGGTDIVGYQP